MEMPRTLRMRRFSGAAPPSWRIMFSGQCHRAVSETNSSASAPGPAETSTVISGMAATGAPGRPAGGWGRLGGMGLRLGTVSCRSSEG